MSYQVLARKWRPKSFAELVGQEAVVQALVNGLDNDRVHHAFLFTGTRGVGKTTIARIFAKCLNCETNGVTSTPCGECASCLEVDEGRFVDMLEIDAASRTKVDDTRELLETVQFAPTRGRYKVYIIDEVHMLSTASFNALLKTLEEPPPHVKFVLATTDPQKIPVTILSRCLRFNLRRLLPEQISGYLEKLLAEESIEHEAGALDRVARAADGSMRDALSLLDQAIAYGGGALKDAEVADMMGSVDHEHIARIIKALGAQDGTALLDIVGELAAQSRNLESVLEALAEALHRMALVQAVPGYRDPERADWDSICQLAAGLSAEDVQLFYQVAIQGKRDLGLAPDPRTGLEMSLLRMLAFRPASAGQAAPAASGGQAAGQAPSKTVTPSAAAVSAKPRAAAEATAASRQDQPAAEAPKPTRTLEPGPRPEAVALCQGGGRVDWNALQAQLSLSGPVKELARNLELESREGSQWRFLIPETVMHLGSKPMVQKLEAALSSQIGEPVALAVHQATEPVASAAAVTEQAAVERRSDAERSIDEDPTVQSLQEQMGAKIIEDSVQPLQ